jgi:transposase InsO family protein
MRIEPKIIVNKYIDNNYNASKTARELGIHRKTVTNWYKKAKSISGLKPIRSVKPQRKSTRPKKLNSKLSQIQKHNIVKLRKETGGCARKIKYLLKLDVHHNTVHRLLKSKGLVDNYGNHRRPRYQETKHMYLKNTKTIGFLQMDVKYITPELSGLPWTCYEYAIIDIYSRYKDAVILNGLNMDCAISSLLEIVPRLPFKPVFLQTDNGLEFQSRFVKHVQALGMQHHFTHKSSPNENAVIERSFRTDEEEFFFFRMKKPKNYDDLREQFAKWLEEYNTERPHLGIDLKTPMEVILGANMS